MKAVLISNILISVEVGRKTSTEMGALLYLLRNWSYSHILIRKRNERKEEKKSK